MWVRLRVFCPVPTDIPTLWVRCQRIKLDLIGRQIVIFRLFYRVLWTSLDVLGSGSGAAKRIRTPDPRITNSQLASVTHINQCVANAKRGLSLLKAANICSWWYKSGYSWTSTDFFTPPISALA